jgi:hypothetical protein
VIVELKLVQYRDAGMMTFTYFWTHKGRTIGPYFDTDKQAQDWLNERLAIDIAV